MRFATFAIGFLMVSMIVSATVASCACGSCVDSLGLEVVFAVFGVSFIMRSFLPKYCTTHCGSNRSHHVTSSSCMVIIFSLFVGVSCLGWLGATVSVLAIYGNTE